MITQARWYAVSAVLAVYGVIRVFAPDIVVPSEEEVARVVDGLFLIGAPLAVAWAKWQEAKRNGQG